MIAANYGQLLVCCGETLRMISRLMVLENFCEFIYLHLNEDFTECVNVKVVSYMFCCWCDCYKSFTIDSKAKILHFSLAKNGVAFLDLLFIRIHWFFKNKISRCSWKKFVDSLGWSSAEMQRFFVVLVQEWRVIIRDCSKIKWIYY